jgi:hypothetical protein
MTPQMNLNSIGPFSNIKSDWNKNRLFLIIATIFLVGYGIFNARNLIMGPIVEIITPTQKEIDIKDDVIKIKGRAQNIVFLSLNERQIFVDTRGFFEEKLLLYPGSNLIEIKARDRFKNETVKEIKVYYSPSEQSHNDYVEI